jgi:hypothetical protein
MSLRDLQNNKATLSGFKGRHCFASLATNSIRFRFDHREERGRYLWVDPPWVLSGVGGQITTSGEYTEDTFAEWCVLFFGLRECILLDFEETEIGEVTFNFSDGYRLYVPLDPQSGHVDSDYDHWYAHDASQVSQALETAV